MKYIDRGHGLRLLSVPSHRSSRNSRLTCNVNFGRDEVSASLSSKSLTISWVEWPRLVLIPFVLISTASHIPIDGSSDSSQIICRSWMMLPLIPATSSGASMKYTSTLICESGLRKTLSFLTPSLSHHPAIVVPVLVADISSVRRCSSMFCVRTNRFLPMSLTPHSTKSCCCARLMAGATPK